MAFLISECLILFARWHWKSEVLQVQEEEHLQGVSSFLSPHSLELHHMFLLAWGHAPETYQASYDWLSRGVPGN